MQVNISGHHVEITDALRTYVNEKMARLSRHFDHINNAQVTLNVEKLRQKAEATLHVNGGEIHAEATSEDLYTSIDAMIDKLDRQVIKYKEKLTKH